MIDAENGIIRGASLITEGEILGHDGFADRKTLETVLAACQKLGKVKVKLNHGTWIAQRATQVAYWRRKKTDEQHEPT
jgi:hypothetical protein